MTLFIWWCTKKISTWVIFDDYNINLETKYKYQEIAANTIEWAPVIKQYIQQIETGFVWSIIIAKTDIQQPIDIENFASINDKLITIKIPWAKETSTDDFSFKCWSWSIDTILQNITIKEWEETQYLNQLFFATTNKLYWISTITTDKREHKNLSRSIEAITCLMLK